MVYPFVGLVNELRLKAEKAAEPFNADWNFPKKAQKPKNLSKKDGKLDKNMI